MIEKIMHYYDTAMNSIPENARFFLAVVIVIFLVVSLVQFLRKNLLWLVIFIILVPAAWPALKQIGLSIWHLFEKIPK
ncbi:hypothetical protein COT77_02995 [Candidatus Berkelbacteria bacterium CG10_big_fil_rev_8_21_14_0_10_41_12]|uniref:Uncharacterized protein n=1 Tax=Candidatus Berkelbacteria bacterium CG10_big_fil_rev_8_21_14_0_10_41_12 TaxID=1974513 RepID=A0A2M6WWJ3_9BACT|nr:MAG: hypothetical protein COT77_02995 [Candidatus Berkelbacteria bacterium CG10_big_fil_rev_8_21_14_0_10_41_12]